MCGRYYVDDETAREIEKIVRQVNEKLNATRGKRDVYPSSEAAVILNKNDQLQSGNLNWGFPNYNKKGVIFNARSETVLEKRTFRDSVLNRRCIIPAKGFYEWDKDKNKISFQRKDDPVLFMAGFYNHYGEQEHFVILTTCANESVKGVHERMPLILDKKEIVNWVNKNDDWEQLLWKVPVQLIKFGYQQESFLLT